MILRRNEIPLIAAEVVLSRSLLKETLVLGPKIAHSCGLTKRNPSKAETAVARGHIVADAEGGIGVSRISICARKGLCADAGI